MPTGVKPACLFLLLAFSVKAEAIQSFYLHSCVCAFIIESEIAKQRACFVHLLNIH